PRDPPGGGAPGLDRGRHRARDPHAAARVRAPAGRAHPRPRGGGGMSNALTVARKELRALFQSSVALIFLGVFLAVTLFTFFGTARFFARNLADVRPLFEWLPL